MPELPDVEVYVERLSAHFMGRKLVRVRLKSAFVLRSVQPSISELSGRRLTGTERLGKRIVFAFEGELFLVVHLMISGRFQLKELDAKIPGKLGLAALDFENKTLLLTEASSKKRASMHVVGGRDGLAELDPGGLEPLDARLEDFSASLTRENRTLKRALTDPRIFSGIGNAYSDEILHRAGLSPVKRTHQLSAGEIERLHVAVQATLSEWLERLRREAGDGFPTKVTAFRPEMAVHGRYKLPCPVCDTAVQRIAYADRELNYCPRCQTGGKLLADRGLSRLLKGDWPKTIEELEERRAT